VVGVGPQNVVYDVEVRPPEWGLLDDTPAVVSNVLRAIARTNSTSLMRYRGMTFEGGEPVFPGE
jgi:hypothetical protein